MIATMMGTIETHGNTDDCSPPSCIAVGDGGNPNDLGEPPPTIFALVMIMLPGRAFPQLNLRQFGQSRPETGRTLATDHNHDDEDDLLRT